MKKELQQKLFNKYPKIFMNRSLSITDSCMGWGLDVPDSWYKLLDKLCSKIQKLVDSTEVDQVHADQVKEKFGTLRFYVDNYNPRIDFIIDEAERESSETCACCGSKDKVKASKGWIAYLCQYCRKKKIAVWS